MFHQTLHDGWRLSATTGEVPAHIAGRTVPAQVPGSAHLDLLAAGLIPDPYVDRAEEELAWAHRTGWRYALTFDAAAPAPDERADLAFDGLDTVATVELNGHLLGATANMHRSYRFDARQALRAGVNELVVSFRSALEYAEEAERELGYYSRTYPHPFNMVRKMACSFGWNWGPDLQTAGIWKPVRLERWATARLARVRPLATVTEGGAGRIEVHAEIERAGTGDDRELVLVVRGSGREVHADVAAGETSAVATLEIPDVALWWPDGYGDQPLYDLVVEVRDGSGTKLDAATRRVGFRTVTVDVTPDESGTPFTFVVNGKPVFVKGANWIPDDHFVTRITRERLARRVDQAIGAHINLLRVWGGGIYETEDFYDVCDERGMLVWQDFPFSDAAYPEEEPLRSEVAAEVRENVARLASHPALALWNGANENMWGYRDWGWPKELGDRTWGYGYYTELLPRIVAELDPTRCYAVNSPYSPGPTPPGEPARHPNDPRHGTTHLWDVWSRYRDYSTYRDQAPRFVAEFGYQAPPAYATLQAALPGEQLTSGFPRMLGRQKDAEGDTKLHYGLSAHLPEPNGFDDWHYLAQLNQARAIQLGVEHFRSLWPACSGTILWQLNDCWPGHSWSAIDGAGRAKPMWYALRRAYAERLLTIQPRGDGLHLIAVNDTDQEWSQTVRVARTAHSGEEYAAESTRLVVEPRGSTSWPIPAHLGQAGEPTRELLRAGSTGQVLWFFAEDRDIPYPPARYTARVEPDPGAGEYRVTVTAQTILRSLALFPDRLDPLATVDDALLTLIPGQSVTFLVHSARPLDPAALTAPPVLRCVNDIRTGKF